MHCPRCHIKVTGYLCTQCGAIVYTDSTDTDYKLSTPNLNPDIHPHTPKKNRPSSQNRWGWKKEVRQKLREHYRKHPAESTLDQNHNKKQIGPLDTKWPQKHKVDLFGHRQKGAKKRSEIATETPLIRKPVAGTVKSQHLAVEQKTLSLETAYPPVKPDKIVEEIRPQEIPVSREILFSRLLAGIVDILIPVLLGALFTFTASQILQFNFFSTNSIWFGASFATGFYFLNSLFFLVLTGQTPGMYLTYLQLVGEKSEEVATFSLLVRTTCFLPVAVTILGLVAAIFDPWHRCLHDRISGTRVIPTKT